MNDLLRHARAVGASDLHLAAGTVPHLRVHGVLSVLPLPEVTADQIEAWIAPILSPERQKALADARQLDFCHKDQELGRFRTNVFFQRKGANAVFRLIPAEVPSLADIDLPESVWELTTYSQGLVLVTGPAGCGKTTTLAAMINRINETQKSHILTIEDPIEYVHRGKLALVNQREVPGHAGFLRQGPAPGAARGSRRHPRGRNARPRDDRAGHHRVGNRAPGARDPPHDDRELDRRPHHQLLPAGPAEPDPDDGRRLVEGGDLPDASAAPRRLRAGGGFEILRNTGNVAGMIRDGKTFQIPTAIQTGSSAGMVSMDGALKDLLQKGAIDTRVAYDHAQRKETFETMLAAEEGGAA